MTECLKNMNTTNETSDFQKRPGNPEINEFSVLNGVLIAGCLLLLAMLWFSSVTLAGEYNEVLSIGDQAPAWTDLPGTDGNKHSMADLSAKPVLVVVFTCRSCPTAADYEDRINALAKKHGGPQGQVAVVAICVNQIPEDELPALTKRAQEKQFQFDYLYDGTQKIARDYGAVFTPEFYVFDRDRKLVYMGAMDDATNPDQVSKSYVEAAIQAALSGQTPEQQEVIARGCRVRYARTRRRPSTKKN